MFLLILGQLIITLIFFLTHRHRATILPLCLIFQSFTLFWFIEQLKERKAVPLLIILLFSLIVAIAFPPFKLNREDVDFLTFSKTGAILEKKGDLRGSQGNYRRAIALNPHDANTLCNLANTYAVEKNYAAAIPYYEKALSLVPYHIDALYNLAFVYEELKEYGAAIKLYQQVVALDPTSYDATFHLGLIYKNLGDCPHAFEHFEKTIRINPSLKNYVSRLLPECQKP